MGQAKLRFEERMTSRAIIYCIDVVILFGSSWCAVGRVVVQRNVSSNSAMESSTMPWTVATS